MRDPLGLAPCYYRESGDHVVFAGSPAEVLEILSQPARPDPEGAVAHLHGHGPPPGRTFLAGVREVEPGTVQIWDRSRSWAFRYWRPGRRPTAPGTGEAAERLAEILDRVAADFASPSSSAVSMSGGLDSTTVAAALGPVERGPLQLLHRTAPDYPEADEEARATRVARHLRLPLHEVRADLHLPLSRPDGIATTSESPVFPAFSDPWEATFREAGRLGIEVVYTGAGGDHLFGGSHQVTTLDLLLSGRLARLLHELRDRHLAAGSHRGPLLVDALVRPAARALLPRWRPTGRTAVPWLGKEGLAVWRRTHRHVAFPPYRLGPILPGRRDRLRFLGHRGSVELSLALARQARGHGIEIRHPLFDPRLVDYVASLPSWEVVRSGESKALLRRAMRRRLPASVVAGGGKVFPFALFRHALTRSGAHHVKRLLTDMRAAEVGLVDEGALRAAYDRYCRGGGGGGLLWNALTLEDWLRRHH